MVKTGSKLIYLLIIIIIIITAWGMFHCLENEKPQINVLDDIDMIGRKKDIAVTFSDMRSGIRSYSIILVQKENEYRVAEENIPLKGTSTKKLAVTIIPSKLGIKDGKASLKIHVVDFSPLKNSSLLQKEVIIDSFPPQATLISTGHYINPGGSCLIIYTASDDAVKSGVKFGDNFFPGYPAKIGGKQCYASYIAVPMEIEDNTTLNVIAWDKAENDSVAEVPYYVRKSRKFRHDKVKVSESFVNSKAALFQKYNASLAGQTTTQIFSYINDTLRKENNQQIYNLCRKSEARQLWQGSFLRMKNAANMALFGDKRTYIFKGNDVGKSIHKGIDLASVRHAPIQAANSGKIIFAGEIGIYGNTVIIDHGQGLSSLYAHLSSMNVKEGQDVVRGDIIGRSGKTGFAGGDHLHFSMLAGGIFVNPIEWWDTHWIRDNIVLKQEKAEDLL
jgi:murein DD-endopeptidase MepM/ murein hydrolase activator NlpD